MTPTAGYPTATRRRHPWVRRLVVLVIVLAVLLVVVDRGGDYVAERVAADKLQSSQHLASRPDVSIDGVPFLTQFAQGNYDHVVVDTKNLPLGNGALTISHLHVDLHQLAVSRSFSTFHVTRATATATIDYATLSNRLGITLSYAGNDRLRASKTFDLPVVGAVTPTITVLPIITDGVLSFGKSTINGAGESLGVISEALNKIFDVSIPLDGLPFDITVRSLTVDAQGLEGQFAGSDLTYST